MTYIRELVERLELEYVAGETGADREVTGGYCGDLLSDVMANALRGELWITIQSHKNIVGVAVLGELAGILLVNGHRPDEGAKAKADEEGIPILVTPRSAFEMAGLLYELGLGGMEE
jgi:predicted transcriptional regulator